MFIIIKYGNYPYLPKKRQKTEFQTFYLYSYITYLMDTFIICTKLGSQK